MIDHAIKIEEAARAINIQVREEIRLTRALHLTDIAGKLFHLAWQLRQMEEK